jgi:ABC-type amino acid transport substrate-binding protein
MTRDGLRNHEAATLQNSLLLRTATHFDRARRLIRRLGAVSGCVVTALCANAPSANPDAIPTQLAQGFDEPIRVGISFDYPPYEYVDHAGTPQGFNVDALRAVAALRGLLLKFEPGIWSHVADDLQTGEVRILPSVLHSKEREDRLAFSQPLLSVEYSIFVRKGSRDIASLADLRDRTVVLETDSLMHEFLIDANLNAQIMPVASEPEALRILNQGQFDAALAPYRQGLAITAEYDLESIEPAGPPILSASLSFAVAPDDLALLAELDLGLEALRENGGFQALYNEHFGTPADVFSSPPSSGAKSWWNNTTQLFVCILLAIALVAAAWGLQRRLQPSARRRFGGYELIERIGIGGMGEVWLANHIRLSRSAAIKLVRVDALQGDAESAEHARIRFEREARSTAALSSPNTIELYDFGEAPDGSLYYAMELLDGLDLQRLVGLFGPVPPERAIHLLIQICASLEEAHRQGLLHRDIKPANVYACKQGTEHDVAKVLDFGLVKLRSEAGDAQAQHITSTELVTGTPICIAPELIEGHPPPDHRVDLYSTGCVAYWLLTGSTVFQAQNPVAMAVAHVTEAPVPPSQRSGLDIPADLEAIVMRCLAKHPDERPASADALASALRACADAANWTPDRADAWWQEHAAAIEAAPPSHGAKGSESV